MKAKLMNGTYYEIANGMEEDLIVNLMDTDMSDMEVRAKAADEERTAYKNTYINGKRIDSVRLYDPYRDAYYPINEDINYEPLPHENQFEYRMLSRLKADCEYFLGNGNRFEGHLSAGSVEEQIKEMKQRWNEFEDDEKPEWLTMEDIEEYERRMAI